MMKKIYFYILICTFSFQLHALKPKTTIDIATNSTTIDDVVEVAPAAEPAAAPAAAPRELTAEEIALANRLAVLNGKMNLVADANNTLTAHLKTSSSTLIPALTTLISLAADKTKNETLIELKAKWEKLNHEQKFSRIPLFQYQLSKTIKELNFEDQDVANKTNEFTTSFNEFNKLVNRLKFGTIESYAIMLKLAATAFSKFPMTKHMEILAANHDHWVSYNQSEPFKSKYDRVYELSSQFEDTPEPDLLIQLADINDAIIPADMRIIKNEVAGTATNAVTATTTATATATAATNATTAN